MSRQENDIWLWSLARTTLTRVTFDPGIDACPVWTPDGRRLIFSSERSGRRNLFWQAPDGTGAVERLTESLNPQNALSVSCDGTRCGAELFYIAPSGALMRVGVERGQSWAATPPATMLKEGYLTATGLTPGLTYDISADAQRFLMIKSGGGASDPATTPPSLIVVQNWREELKRLVPAN